MSVSKNDDSLLIEKLKYIKKRFDSIYRNSPLAFISWNKDGRIIDLNEAAVKLFGWEKDFLKNRDFIATIIAESDQELWEKWQNGQLSEFPRDLISKAVDQNNNIISCSWNNLLIKEDNQVEEVISIAKNLNNKLSNETQMLNLVKAIDETDNWVVITDKKGQIEYANKTVKTITGYKKEEIIGQNPSIFKSEKHDQDFYQDLWQTIKKGEVFNDVLINKRKNGEYFYSEQTITPIKNNNGEIVNFISVGKDITQNEKLKQKIEYISNYDISFGLPNRKAVLNKVESIIEYENKDKIAAMVININRLKYLNNIYEDEVEKSLVNLTAELINQKLAEFEISVNIDNGHQVSYLGGNNFVIIFDNLESVNAISKIAEQILDIFAESIYYNDEIFMLNARVGISVYPDDCLNSQNLLSNAEIALINIEDNDYAFFDDQMNRKIKEFTKMEAKLDRAVKNDEFVLYYQPYYQGENHELFGFEALIRWQDPERGLVSPAEFIPVLENSQLIKKVGLLVVEKAAAALNRWIKLGYQPVPVSINLSPKQLEDSRHLAQIYEIIAQSGIDSSLIKFEITESSAMDDVDYSLKIMNKMKEKGFSIAIDDFGTGYSSFSYLQKFPIDCLKIDISFIRNMTLSADGKNIVESIINIAHLLDLYTIAEGVEEEIELNELNRLNNDYIQGYYYARPMPELEADKLFKHK